MCLCFQQLLPSLRTTWSCQSCFHLAWNNFLQMCKSAKWCAKWVMVHINFSGKGNVALLFIVTLVWDTYILGVHNVQSKCCDSTRCTQVSLDSRIWNNTVKQTLVFSRRKPNYCPAASVCGQLARPDRPQLQLTAAEPRNRFTTERLSYAVKHVAYYASSCQYKALQYWFKFWKHPYQDTDSHLLSVA